MTRSEVLFKIVDIICHPGQNYRKYPNITKEGNICYDAAFPKECVGEFFYDPKRRAESKKMPVILNVHGGGFVKGDMCHRQSLSGRYADNGYFVFNINYRLSPKYGFPAGVVDCMKALALLPTVAEKYNLDMDKICVTGDSAGAYYATMMVAVSNDATLREKLGIPEPTVKPAVLLSFCGPYDLVASITLTKLPFHMVWDIGRCYLDSADYHLKKDFSNVKDYPLLDYVSPLNFVNSSWCPSFLVMAKKDVFCKGQGELLEKKLKEANVEVESFSSVKFINNHCFHLEMFHKISEQCYQKAFTFIDKHLK